MRPSIDAFLGAERPQGQPVEAEAAQTWGSSVEVPARSRESSSAKVSQNIITSQFLLLRNVARAPEPRVVPTTISGLVHPRRAAQRVVVRAVDGVDEGAAP